MSLLSNGYLLSSINLYKYNQEYEVHDTVHETHTGKQKEIYDFCFRTAITVSARQSCFFSRAVITGMEVGAWHYLSNTIL